jgi:hypothetical protein
VELRAVIDHWLSSVTGKTSRRTSDVFMFVLKTERCVVMRAVIKVAIGTERKGVYSHVIWDHFQNLTTVIHAVFVAEAGSAMLLCSPDFSPTAHFLLWGRAVSSGCICRRLNIMARCHSLSHLHVPASFKGRSMRDFCWTEVYLSYRATPDIQNSINTPF